METSHYSFVNLRCPHCKKDSRTILQKNHNNKQYTFDCGHCRTHLEDIFVTSKNQLEIEDTLDSIFRFDIEEDIKNHVNFMTYQEKVDRLRELSTPEEFAYFMARLQSGEDFDE